MRRRLVLAVLAAGVSLGAAAGTDLTDAASAWLRSLDDGQRGDALYAFDDDERFDLRLAPLFLEGLRRDAMTDAQWQGWRRVLAHGLSDAGLAQVETVMSLEREVRRRDQRTWFGDWTGSFVHGEQRYYVALFGEPADGRAWGLRFDGHHVSLNWTVAPDGRISATPSFVGGEPREVPAGWERAGLQVLAAEENAARALWNALDAGQRSAAQRVFEQASGPAGANRPLFLGEGERIALGSPAGVAHADMTPAQRALLDALVDTYLSRLATPLHAARNAAIDAGGRGALHFAWAGSFAPGEPLYYRVQGPTLLIEFDNTVAEADHIHTIVRESEGDFGRDLLARHYRDHHARPQLASR